MEDGEVRVAIRVIWRGVAGVNDGASELFTVSPALNAEQIALLPPPVRVRTLSAQFDLSKGAIGVVHRGKPLDGGAKLADILAERDAGDSSQITFELSPIFVLREKFGEHVAQPAEPAPSTPTSPIKTRHMTSVQLIEYLRANGVEPPDGLGTPRSVLRKKAAEIEGD
eukprot:CAMPEP_0119419160 /NCGR_PEP_ID=MMETSP1335-20130426/20080_1 /TAXON_ID=259385 /ORGANISM="Chrysoculter rhomboideus, Strain RCC1486" /LENGTH=167 /DNA_ID=CAMNT_0007444449 /DNA_START=39 /DNA_END=542 /DNA_ORIENTATION=-